MKSILKISLIAIFAFIATISVYSQEWTKEQKEVWKAVEDEWSIWKNGDVEGLAAIMHEKYQSWNNTFPLPVSKSMTVDYFKQMNATFKVINYSINPARITVTENSAAAYYYFSFSYSYGEGESKKKENEKGRYVEFYTRQGGKWLLLGDMMVPDDEEEDD